MGISVTGNDINIHDYRDGSDFITECQFAEYNIESLMVGEKVGSQFRIDISSEQKYQDILDRLTGSKVFRQILFLDGEKSGRYRNKYFHIPGVANSMLKVYRGTEEAISLYIERINPTSLIRKLDLGYIKLNEALGDADGLRVYGYYNKHIEELSNQHKKEINNIEIEDDPFSELEYLLNPETSE